MLLSVTDPNQPRPYAPPTAPPPGSGQPTEPPSRPSDPAGAVPASAPPPGYAPPGYAPPAGYGPPAGHAQAGGYPATGAPSSGSSASISLSTWWGLLSVVAIVLAVSIPEDNSNQWKVAALWAAFAIAAALLTLAPTFGAGLKLTQARAWQVAAGGFGGLVAYWVLFVLPSISRNVSFLATVAVVAGGLAVATAPGRPDPSGGRSQGEWW